MDLPVTESGNKHVLVFQDFLTKWPMIYPIPNQQTVHIVRLFAEQVVPMFGVPEALLSDRGTNPLSHLMLDCCQLLGMKKINTTAYHPECDGMVERFNRTLKTTIRKRVDQFGVQWDEHLSGLLWAYRNDLMSRRERNLCSCYMVLIVDLRLKLLYYRRGRSRPAKFLITVRSLSCHCHMRVK
ncbi:uncharacterized protein LOC134187352 [Corticium candelabrum]|uniref:uncharacterized protein LOC134187352 n=1 Tax=Corticium candelabrum TaxID=121492 RepID=UPI002E25285F|nr:uncharacterized protein LOC134187352 [Corticium candelabrum]